MVNFTAVFAGQVDEARISNIARSADWLTTEYNNQTNPSAFVVVGSEQSSQTNPTLTALSLDFVGQASPMGASDTAGVVPLANWNNGLSNAGTMALVDQNGATTTASATWSSDNAYALPIWQYPGNSTMMAGYLDNVSGNPTTINVSGLPAAPSGYTVYVYVDGDNPSYNRTGSYSISGTGVTTQTIQATDPANVDYSGFYSPNGQGVFTQANNSTGNYIVFTIPGGAASFTLTATPGYTNGSYPRAPVNGIQIVPITSTSATYTIAGRVQLNGSGFAGASVTLNNGFTTTTDSAGNYSFSGLTNAMYTITPALNGYAFAPATQTVTVSNGNPTVNDFVGQALVATVAKPVSIDFVGEGSPMDLSETAGVAPESRWNNAMGLSGTVNLIDKDGALNGATVTWHTAELDSLPIYDLPGNYRMMGGYLAANWSGDPATVTITGLLPSTNGYTVYVYADGDNGSDSRSASYSLSGSGTTTQTVQLTDAPNTDYSGASPNDGQGVYTQANNSAGNYVVFTVTGTSFTITATPGATNGNYPRAPLNGIQIVPNP